MQQKHHSKQTTEDDIDDFTLPESDISLNLGPQAANNNNLNSSRNVPPRMGTSPHGPGSSEPDKISYIPRIRNANPLPHSSDLQVPNSTTSSYSVKTDNTTSGCSDSAKSNQFYSPRTDLINRYHTTWSLPGSLSKKLASKTLRLSDIVSLSAQEKKHYSDTEANTNSGNTSKQTAFGTMRLSDIASLSAQNKLSNSAPKADTNIFNNNQLGLGTLRLSDIVALSSKRNLPSCSAKPDTNVYNTSDQPNSSSLNIDKIASGSLNLKDLDALSANNKLPNSITKTESSANNTSTQIGLGTLKLSDIAALSAQNKLTNSITKSATNIFNNNKQLGLGTLRLSDIAALSSKVKSPSSSTNSGTNIYDTAEKMNSTPLDNNKITSGSLRLESIAALSAQNKLQNSTAKTFINSNNTSNHKELGTIRLKDIVASSAQRNLPISSINPESNISNTSNNIASGSLDNNKIPLESSIMNNIAALGAQGRSPRTTTKPCTDLCKDPIIITSPNDSVKKVRFHDSNEAILSGNNEELNESIDTEARKRANCAFQTALNESPSNSLKSKPQPPPLILVRPTFPQTTANMQGKEIKESQLPNAVANDQQPEKLTNGVNVSKVKELLHEDNYAQAHFEGLKLYNQSKQLPAPAMNKISATPCPICESSIKLNSGPSNILLQKKNFDPSLDKSVDNLEKNEKVTEESDAQNVLKACGDLVGLGLEATESYCPPKDYYELRFDHTPVAYDEDAVATWIYPINYPLRDYQFDIVQRCLFENTLVVLPMGLGRTFISSVVMLNYHRWFPNRKVLFMAPTRPLVSQQIKACFDICGMQDAQELVSDTNLANLQDIRTGNRVIYSTPDVVLKYLKAKLLDPCDISCVVIDKAHHAQGSHGYADVINYIYATNPLFRIIALTATPGTDLAKVQQVVFNLKIARVESRNINSVDVKPYFLENQIDKYIVKLDGEHLKIISILKELVQPYLDFLISRKLLSNCSPDSALTQEIITAQTKFKSRKFSNADKPLAKKIYAEFSLASQLVSFLDIFNRFGVTTLHNYIKKSVESNTKIYDYAYKVKHQLKELVSKLEVIMSNPNYYSNNMSHPKLDILCRSLKNHFRNQANPQETQKKIIVFVQTDTNVQEIYAALKQMMPVVRPTVLYGNGASSLGAKNMRQENQLNPIKRFKEGSHNVLILTCVGDEHLDIDKDDLIICYDGGRTMAYLLQHMGWTGQQRKGKLYLLLSEGRQENRDSISLKEYSRSLKQITPEKLVLFSNNPRILPTCNDPVCVKKHIVIPERSSIATSTNKQQKRPARTSFGEDTNEDMQMLSKKIKIIQPPKIRRLLGNLHRQYHLPTTNNDRLINHSSQSKLLANSAQQYHSPGSADEARKPLPGIEEIVVSSPDTSSILDQSSNKQTKLPTCFRNNHSLANATNHDNIKRLYDNEINQPENQSRLPVLIDLVSPSPLQPRVINHSKHCFSELLVNLNHDITDSPSQKVILPYDVNQDSSTPQPLAGFRNIDRRVAIFNHHASTLFTQTTSNHSGVEQEASLLAQVITNGIKEGGEPTSQVGNKSLSPKISQAGLGTNTVNSSNGNNDGDLVLTSRKRNCQLITDTHTANTMIKRHHSNDSKRRKTDR